MSRFLLCVVFFLCLKVDCSFGIADQYRCRQENEAGHNEEVTSCTECLWTEGKPLKLDSHYNFHAHFTIHKSHNTAVQYDLLILLITIIN